MYLVAFIVVYLLLLYRLKKKEAPYSKNSIFDLLLYLFAGVLIGGRLGYVFFYNFNYFWQHPLAIIFPFDTGGNYIGISGMSYYGGVIGIILVSFFFARKQKLNFWQLADFVIPAIPAGYFFGRLGNFLNGELFGRVTEKPWGMYFADGLPGQGLLRHPSQLYEAFFEGLVLFVIFWMLRNKSQNGCHPELDSGSKASLQLPQGIRFRIKSGMTVEGSLLLAYLFLYGSFRFFIEFFRQPDIQIGLFFNPPVGGLTLGQIFSVIAMLATLSVYGYNYKIKFKN